MKWGIYRHLPGRQNKTSLHQYERHSRLAAVLSISLRYPLHQEVIGIIHHSVREPVLDGKACISSSSVSSLLIGPDQVSFNINSTQEESPSMALLLLRRDRDPRIDVARVHRRRRHWRYWTQRRSHILRNSFRRRRRWRQACCGIVPRRVDLVPDARRHVALLLDWHQGYVPGSVGITTARIDICSYLGLLLWRISLCDLDSGHLRTKRSWR